MIGPPLLVGLVAFRVFVLLQAAYTSEAQLQVNEALWLDHEQQLTTQTETHPRVVRTMEEMQELIPYQFLAYVLVLHDIDSVDKRFGPRVDSILQPDLWGIGLIDTLRDRLSYRRTMGETKTDTLLREMFKRLQYQPHRLKGNLTVNQIPGTSIIRLEADSRSPEMSTFVVNTFTQAFINYRQGKERSRLEAIRDDLAKQVSKEGESLQQQQATLDAEQAAMSTQIDDKAWELKRRIFRLEAARERENRRVGKLKSALKSKRRSSQNVIQIKDQQADPIELGLELEDSQNRIQIIDQQIETIKEQLTKYEASRLAPLSQRIESQRATYQNLSNHYEKVSRALVNVDKLLIQVVKGKTRHPIPYSAQFIGIQAGITTFLLWLLFLLQIRYLRLIKPTPSK